MTRRLHIVNVCFVGRFGLADYTLSLARALARHARSTIVTARDFDYPHVPFDGEVERLFRRSRHYPLDVLRFLLRMWRVRPDVIIFQAPLKLAWLDGLVARILRWRGIRMATTVHDVLPHYPRPWSKLEFSFFYRSFDRLIAHSDEAKQRLRAMGFGGPILVVPHGEYDIYRLKNLGRAEARSRIAGLAHDDFVALFFGKIDERKGIGPLADFVTNHNAQAPLRILLAGLDGVPTSDTELRPRLDRLIAHGRCVARLHRIPFEDVEELFAAADVVLLPYLEGSTSGVMKLAMAFRRPVIATDVGDLPESIEADAGIIISHQRVTEELGAALERMRTQYPTFEAGCASVSEKYSFETIAERVSTFLSNGKSHTR